MKEDKLVGFFTGLILFIIITVLGLLAMGIIAALVYFFGKLVAAVFFIIVAALSIIGATSISKQVDRL